MTEEQKFKVVDRMQGYELRSYQPCVVAEVEISAKFETAANEAFRYLINYIGGKNEARNKIAMTAPVLQIPSPSASFTEGEVDDLNSQSHLVSFVMPSEMHLGNTPAPDDSRINIRELPEELVAVLKFSGRWSKERYLHQLEVLKGKFAADGFQEVDDARFARFDPPWTPWFLRRNEIQIPVKKIGSKD